MSATRDSKCTCDIQDFTLYNIYIIMVRHNFLCIFINFLIVNIKEIF